MSGKDFSVWSMYSIDPNKILRFEHWAEGLTVYIRKGDKEIAINGDEMKRVIKSLPKTFGGTY